MTQHEITEAIPLLDARGNLTEPGWARSLLPVYNREAITAGRMRVKEWDYYLIANDHRALALTIDDNGYMGLDSVSVMDFEKKTETTVSPIIPFTMGRRNLPRSSAAGDIAVAGKSYALSFRHEGGRRLLHAEMKNFGGRGALLADIILSDEPGDSMVICTPFAKDGHFYYNQKINCLRAEGQVTVGEEQFTFRPEDSFAVLDWGRGVWTYKNTWYWGSGSGLDTQGNVFGFNIGYGFGDTSRASENMLFFNGAGHKLSQVTFNIPQKDGRDDYLSPWTFTSDDGRFEMDFLPILDRKSNTNALLIQSDQHQVFGRYSGKAVLDDGRVVEIRDFIGFAEKVKNRW